MFARISRYEVDEERMDDAVEAFGDALTEIRDLDGFHTAYVFTDPETGTAVTVTIWDDQRTCESSATRAAVARQRAINAVDGSIKGVDVYSVPLEVVREAA